jgi:hypothetical protein
MEQRARCAWAAFVLLFACGVVPLRADLREPRVEVGRLAQPPAIDGRVDEADVRTTLEDTIRHPDQPERFLEARAAIAQAIERLQAATAATRNR